MEYVAHRRLEMRTDPEATERWLHGLLKETPTLLGLGDLDVKDSERSQPGGGRLDLLLQDPETSTRYEVELQLGPTDASHIIRTIEYWDVERRRYPQYQHVAVIVAEDITARFFNVISLLNGQIPIIAIQVNLIEVGSARTLVFTRVLDYVTLGPDEGEPPERKDRGYWIAKGSQQTVALANRLLELAQESDPGVALNYNKHYIGLAKAGLPRNYFIVMPRKSHLIAAFALPYDPARQEELEAQGFDLMPYGRAGRYRLRLTPKDLEQRAEALRSLVEDAERHYGEQPGDG